MPVHVIVTLTAMPGKGAEYAASWKGRIELVRQEPGCLRYELFQSLDDPDKLILHETWSDGPALDSHTEVSKSFPPTARGLTAAPYTWVAFNEIASGGSTDELPIGDQWPESLRLGGSDTVPR
jgi:quinol monooxygenase YgiN